MRTVPSLAFPFAVAALLAGRGLAQNDDCPGAINVVQGTNGPYNNTSATTSFPWSCGAGGKDLWFSYVAPGAGSLTVDTCTGGFDTVLELFDGNLGCGSLTSLGCNDDSCGVQSSLTVTVNTGDTIMIRVGGYSSAAGSFPVNINGPAGSGTIATATAYGTGCYNRYASFYEYFATAAAFDLSNTSFSMLPLGGAGYTVVPGITTFVPPSPSATSLTLTDDSSTSVTLPAPFAYDGGVTSSLEVGSNGWVAVAPGNTTTWTPTVASFLSNPATAWYCWRDMNPAAAGSGQVKFEAIGSIAYVTYDGVYDFDVNGPTAANANTMQFQFDTATGLVHVVFQTMSPLGSTAANATLVGYSYGGISMDPSSIDISAALAGSLNLVGATAEGPGMSLSPAGRPVLGNSMTLNTANIPNGTAVGANLLGFGQFNPGIDLSIIGMPGCFQYVTLDAPVIFVVSGTTASMPLSVPNNPALTGMHLFAQSATFTTGFNAFGVLSSNGLDLGVGNL